MQTLLRLSYFFRAKFGFEGFAQCKRLNMFQLCSDGWSGEACSHNLVAKRRQVISWLFIFCDCKCCNDGGQDCQFLAALAALCPPWSLTHWLCWIQLQNFDQTIPNLPELPMRPTFLTHLKYLTTWSGLDIPTHLIYLHICPTHLPDLLTGPYNLPNRIDNHPESTDNLPEPTDNLKPAYL